MKELTTRQMAAIKRAAMTIAPLDAKYAKLCEKEQKILEEKDKVLSDINAFEQGVQRLTGKCTNFFVTRKVTKAEIDGKIVSKTEYVLTDNVKFNEETGKYEWEEPEINVKCEEELKENFED